MNLQLPSRASLLVLWLLVAALPALAQTRSDTGRSRQQKVEKKESAKIEMTPAEVDSWTFGVGGGLLGSGRIFQVETAAGVAVPWDLGGGAAFQASRFNATFDQNFSVGLQVSKGVGRYLGLLTSLGYCRLDLGAEALVGQSGAAILLDRVDLLHISAGVSGKLVARPSHPFLTAELIFTSLGASRIQELDQSNLGFRLGIGYRRVLSPHWAARVQARLSRTQFSFDDYTPGTSPGYSPEVVFESENHLTFFEIILSVEFN